MERGKTKTRIGIVVSNKMDKTVVVEVANIVTHPFYKKHIRRNSKFKAHDEHNQCRMGDKVLIFETRPYSKSKRWRVGKIVDQATLAEAEILEDDASGEMTEEGEN